MVYCSHYCRLSCKTFRGKLDFCFFFLTNNLHNYNALIQYFQQIKAKQQSNCGVNSNYNIPVRQILKLLFPAFTTIIFQNPDLSDQTVSKESTHLETKLYVYHLLRQFVSTRRSYLRFRPSGQLVGTDRLISNLICDNIYFNHFSGAKMGSFGER